MKINTLQEIYTFEQIKHQRFIPTYIAFIQQKNPMSSASKTKLGKFFFKIVVSGTDVSIDHYQLEILSHRNSESQIIHNKISLANTSLLY